MSSDDEMPEDSDSQDGDDESDNSVPVQCVFDSVPLTVQIN